MTFLVHGPTRLPIRFTPGPRAHRGTSREREPMCYWDQASVLVQLGLLDPSRLPCAGVETARKVVDPSLPSNGLMQRS